MEKIKTYASTQNACKLCAPLGACVAFRGIEGCVPIVHGSQGCSTYIRRYMISHFKEPMDIASSNFSEATTIYGGNKNFVQGINNLRKSYNPSIIGIASTCLAETIGEDVPALIAEYKMNKKEEGDAEIPEFIYASTASYRGSHMDGFHETVCSAVKILTEKSEVKGSHINILSGFISPADIRNLKTIISEYGVDAVILPDYSDSLDNPCWQDYHLIPEGGTSVTDIKRMGSACGSVEMGHIMNKGSLKGRINKNIMTVTAGEWLQKECGVPTAKTLFPIGIAATDDFLAQITAATGVEMPESVKRERGRLIDAYVDAHKYVFGKKALIYGEEDMVLGMVSFLLEIGIIPIIIGSGGESGVLAQEVNELAKDKADQITVLTGADFEMMREEALLQKPDLVIGHSKGYYIARELNIPLVRVGFPIHDRIGGPRLEHILYKGTQSLFDRITNAVLEHKQENSPIGWKYM